MPAEPCWQHCAHAGGWRLVPLGTLPPFQAASSASCRDPEQPPAGRGRQKLSPRGLLHSGQAAQGWNRGAKPPGAGVLQSSGTLGRSQLQQAAGFGLLVHLLHVLVTHKSWVSSLRWPHHGQQTSSCVWGCSGWEPLVRNQKQPKLSPCTPPPSLTLHSCTFHSPRRTQKAKVG